MSVTDATTPPPLESTSYVDADAETPLSHSGAGSTHEDGEMQDLFGEDAEPVLNTAEALAELATPEPAEALSPTERKHREAMEYAEEDEPEQVEEQILEANAAIPNIPVPRSSDGNFWVIRMPNFVKMDSKPFHSDTYIGPEQEDEDTQHAESPREKSMTIKLKVENTIRWRWLKDEQGNERRQANARVVRWSDGSLSLQLGKELFDINQSVDTSGATVRQSVGNSQLQTVLPPSQASALGNKSQGLTYLVAQHKRAGILQCEALVTGYMSLRPTSMQSETHRMLVRAVGQKHNKVARLRMAPDPTFDPEREKVELIKQAARKPKKARGDDDGLGGVRRRRASSSRKRTGDDMWSDDDEAFEGGGGSDEDYGGSVSPGPKPKRGKYANQDISRKGPGEYQTDDFVVADSDEGGSGDSVDGRRNRRRVRRRTGEHEQEGDDLDELEAKIDRQETQERKRKRRDDVEDNDGEAGVDSAHSDARMDIESEEEDDAFAVRRTRGGPGARKRRAIELEEEDED